MPFTSQNSIQQGVPSNLSLIVFLPAAGALVIALLRGHWGDRPLRFSALGVTLATFFLSLPLPVFFRNGTSDMQFVERAPWIPPLGASYHLGGIFAFNPTGIQGGIIQMLNHGISTAGLFFVVGFLYERRHTRAISEYGGLAKPLPWLAAFY